MDAQLTRPRRRGGSTRHDRRSARRWAVGHHPAAVLMLPGLVFAAAFVVVPLGSVVLRSLTDPSPVNYLHIVRTPEHLRALVTTMRISVLTTTACILLGYPYAYAMSSAGRGLRYLLGALVTLPFWTSVLVRTYAWTVLLQDSGVINGVLRRAAVIDDPLPLMRNTFGVVVGLTHILLPFAVLPIYATLRRVDSDLLDAARGLGATGLATFRRVLLPLSMPGVVAAGVLVFLLAQGFYLTPALLGDAQQATLAETTVDLVAQRLAFGEGSALATVLLTLAAVGAGLGLWIVRSLYARLGEP